MTPPSTATPVTLNLAPPTTRGARGKPPRHLADLAPAERKELVAGLGLPGFRARQLSTHYFGRLVDDPAQMTDLPAALRARLEEHVPFSTLDVVTERTASDGTVKALFHTHDRRPIEAVLMRYRDGRRSVCVSSQTERRPSR